MLKQVWITIVVIATVGVVITAFVTRAAAYFILGLPWIVALLLVARPITDFLCALPDRRARWSLNEMLFMCWTRETGVIPATRAERAAAGRADTEGAARGL